MHGCRILALTAVAVFGGVLNGAGVPLHGQIPVAPRELGMGGAYVGVARGYEAVLLAPANLALPDRPSWSIAIPQVALGGTLLGPGARDLRDLIDFNGLSADRQEELLSLIPTTGTEGRFALRAPLASLSSGSWGLGLSYASAGSHTLSRDLAELFLRGYEDGREHYSVGQTSGRRATYWDVALAYAVSDGPWALGVTGHYLRGGALVRTQLFEPRVDVAARTVEVDYVGAIARGGSGYAVDIGAAYQADPSLTLSFTLSNALASLKWPEEVTYRMVTLDRELIENGSPMDIRNRYEYSERTFDPTTQPVLTQRAAEGMYEGATFPAVVRVGLAWKGATGTGVAADYHRRMGDGELADPWEQRIAVGLSQTLWIFGFRGGYAVGSDGGNLLSAGFSLGALDLGVARYQHSALDDQRNRGWIATFGLGVMN